MKYEIIDKLRSYDPFESIRVLEEEYKLSQKFLLENVMTDQERVEYNMKNLLPKCQKEFAERILALEQLNKTMIEILLPFCQKYLLWAAEHNSGIFAKDYYLATKKLISQKEKPEQKSNIIVADVKGTEAEYLKAYECKIVLKNAAVKLRKLIRHFVLSQKELHEHVSFINNYLNESMLPYISIDTLQSYLQAAEKVKL